MIVPPSDCQAPHLPDRVQLFSHRWPPGPWPKMSTVLPYPISPGPLARWPPAEVSDPVARFRSQTEPPVAV